MGIWVDGSLDVSSSVAGAGSEVGIELGEVSDWDESLVERLLSEAYRCVMKKDWSLVHALILASGLSESDIRQECYLRGLLVMPYASGSWRERVNYIYSGMVNLLRDKSRYWQRRTRAGMDSIQLGSLEGSSELAGDSVWWSRSEDEGLEDYIMRVELEGLRRRVIFLERLVGLDTDLRLRYWRWLSQELLFGGE